MIQRFAAILFTCCLFCSITFCEDQKVEALPAALTAKLVFYRASGPFGGLARASIKIDGNKPIHKISNNHTWSTEFPAGPHFFSAEDKQFGRTYVLESRKTYFFRVDMLAPTWTRNGHFRVSNVPADVADGDMTGLKAE